MTLLGTLPIACIASALLADGAVARSSPPEVPPLRLEAKIALGDIEGRIDHLAFDPRRGHVYVAELGNDTIGVVDLEARRLVRTVSGCDEPQGIAYDPSTDAVYVANGGDGSLGMFRAEDFHLLDRISLGSDADNVRVDPVAKRIYVGFGAALAIIDAVSRTKVADIPLHGHPEGFELDRGGDRILVNVPDAAEIAVVGIAERRQLASWPTGSLHANYPLALDPAGKRVITVFRKPARLEALESRRGRGLAGAEACADADDVFVDAERHRVYLICGEGAVETFDESGGGFVRAGRLETTAGSRTGLHVPGIDRVLVAVRASAKEPAAIWVLRPEG